VIVRRGNGLHKRAVLYLKNVPKAIRIGLVGAEEAEIALFGVSPEDVTQHLFRADASTRGARSRV